MRFERNRPSTIVDIYSLYLYFLGLILRTTLKTLVIFKDNKKSQVFLLKWIKKLGSSQIYNIRKRILAFIIKMKLLFRLETIIIGYG
jgi:hypothetical protein